MNPEVFSSNSCEWETPDSFFAKLDEEFGFTLDTCATDENHKCERYYTEEDDGLLQKWTGVCWMNPPYGTSIKKWIAKAYDAAANGAIVVALVPARTDTRWWHRYVMQATEIRFVVARLQFGKNGKDAPFPSAVVVFGTPKEDGVHYPLVSSISKS